MIFHCSLCPTIYIKRSGESGRGKNNSTAPKLSSWPKYMQIKRKMRTYLPVCRPLALRMRAKVRKRWDKLIKRGWGWDDDGLNLSGVSLHRALRPSQRRHTLIFTGECSWMWRTLRMERRVECSHLSHGTAFLCLTWIRKRVPSSGCVYLNAWFVQALENIAILFRASKVSCFSAVLKTSQRYIRLRRRSTVWHPSSTNTKSTMVALLVWFFLPMVPWYQISWHGNYGYTVYSLDIFWYYYGFEHIP